MTVGIVTIERIASVETLKKMAMATSKLEMVTSKPTLSLAVPFIGTVNTVILMLN